MESIYDVTPYDIDSIHSEIITSEVKVCTLPIYFQKIWDTQSRDFTLTDNIICGTNDGNCTFRKFTKRKS